MKIQYKALIAGTLVAGIGTALLPHGHAASAAETTEVPFTFATVDVPVPGARSSTVTGINNRGDLVGSYNFIPATAALGAPAAFLGKGFVWYSDGSFTTIDGPGQINPQLCQPPFYQNCYYMEARGINDQGDIVGTFSQDVFHPNGGLFRAFYQKAGGQFTAYLMPGHANTIFHKVENSGVVYGCFHDEGFDNSSQSTMHGIIAQLGTDNGVQIVSFRNEGTTMNGGGGPGAVQYAGQFYDYTVQRRRGYIINGGDRLNFDVPGSNMTVAWDMNAPGDIVGVWGNNPDPLTMDGIPFHGFMRDRRGNFIDIEYPGSIDTHVFGINDSGAIVGSYVDHDNNIHGFIARPGDVAQMRPIILNEPFRTTPATHAGKSMRVAMMRVIPKDKALLTPAQGPACHQMRMK